MGKTGLHGVKKSSLLGLPKLRHKEERKKILKMCVRKLQSIEDPENFLCRSVLINNTLKTLQNLNSKEVSPLAANERPGRDVQMTDELSSDRLDNLIPSDDDDDCASSRQSEDSKLDDNTSELLIDEAGDGRAKDDEKEEELVAADLDVETSDGGGPQKEASPAQERRQNFDSYCAEDILSDIIMPPPLSPCLEDLTNCTFQDPSGYTAAKPSTPPPPPPPAPACSVPSSAYTGWLDDQLHWDSYHSEQAYKSWGGHAAAGGEEQYKATIDINVLIEEDAEAEEAVVPNKENVEFRSGRTAGEVERKVMDFGEGYHHSCGQSSYLAGIQAVAYSSLLTSLES